MRCRGHLGSTSDLKAEEARKNMASLCSGFCGEGSGKPRQGLTHLNSFAASGVEGLF